MRTVFNHNTPVTAEWFNVVNGFRLRFDGDPALPGDMVDGQYLPIRLQDLDPAILAPYSQSLDVVSTTTNQNINGDKTFINPVTIALGTNANHAITKNQLDSQINVLNTAIANANTARLALEAATVKLTTAQTIAGVKTFSSSPLVPPGSTPGAAVNFAQLPYVGTGVIKINDQQIVYGRIAVNEDWSASGVINLNFSYGTNSPTYSEYTSLPTIQVSTSRLLAIQVEATTTGFNLILDQANSISQPNNAIINYTVYGNI
jgi:hypothetical protein